MDMKEIGGLPDGAALAPRSAANERSPNRKPRTKSVRRQFEAARIKQIWLRLYRATNNPTLASEQVGRHPQTVAAWALRDPEFRTARDAIATMWSSLLDSKFKALGPQALEVVESLLDDSEVDAALRLKLAQWILKSQGVGQEKALVGVEHAGPGGGPIPVKQIVIHLSGEESTGNVPSPAPLVDADYSVLDEEMSSL